jgi:phosphoribosylaminoimidazole-succinocarboxamide synthase
MGSVKDLKVLKKPSPDYPGLGKFLFSDRYSIFDWGEMPDHIPNKGSALAIMGAYCFEQAEKQGIKTHYLGLIGKDERLTNITNLKEPANTMEVKLVSVILPRYKEGNYNYSNFTPDKKNILIPLEIIYRNSLPSGASIFRRLEQGNATYQQFGLDHYPQPGEKLSEPIFDVSTKLESKDRYITWDEAQTIAGLRDSEVTDIKDTLLTINNLITNIAKKANLVNEDGKIELAYDNNRNLMLVDVLGTLDECRFTYNGENVSKEVARQFYTNSKWSKDVEDAKDQAKERKTKGWKKLCKSKPELLDPDLKEIFSQMYTATANEFINRKLFDVPPLEKVINNYISWKEYHEENKKNSYSKA